MTGLRTPCGASLLLFALAAAPLWAGGRELKTVAAAGEALHTFAGTPRGISPALLRQARGVAIIPHVVKAGLLFDGRFGRGVVLARRADGCWSNPVFVTLSGGGVGLQAGIQSTDVILVFKTGHSLDRVLRGKGKLVLGGDVSVAAGPVGREAEAATDALLKAEIFSYSRSRGLFAGVALQGAALLVDHGANEAVYGCRGGRAADVLAHRGHAAVEGLKKELTRLTTPPPPPPPVILVPQPPPPPPPPPLPRRRW
jgi:lipid-binding SYLF domain-containing protein